MGYMGDSEDEFEALLEQEAQQGEWDLDPPAGYTEGQEYPEG